MIKIYWNKNLYIYIYNSFFNNKKSANGVLITRDKRDETFYLCEQQFSIFT